ncbi:hypothetical protein BJY04DRAFT_219753 [Aspergillus karnatakaensis]|uniref:uncharacterized protein n=1 Tax=Aspergillus karnatakaensis TaxID=1810916 RepID=UPI003CCE5144
MSETGQDKSLRVLSCVLCQQRKVRCDRTFPCANCIKSKAQCVPSHLNPRRRKRRFPERELLDRVRRYEDLLRQHDIRFDPLHGEIPKESEDDETSQPATAGMKAVLERSPEVPLESPKQRDSAKNLWDAMNQTPTDSEGDDGTPATHITEAIVKKTWDHVFDNSDPLFGVHNSHIDVSTLHPPPSQIFRLWQIYLDHVDPLFKVTHTPTLQARIVEAIADPKNIAPSMSALMFSIYCVALSSLVKDDCEKFFGVAKDELLATYRYNCHQALVSANFLRSDDPDCLTAFFFYLVSMRPCFDPRALSSMLAMVIRTAQRMGIHDESSCAKYPPLQAELRRRLWWALVLFDARIGELADHRNTTLNPLWDCKVPSNLNDLDLRAEAKYAPPVQGPLSEAVFAVVRCELGEYLRKASFHLSFFAPSLKEFVAKNEHLSPSGTSGLDAIDKQIEEKYLQFCNPDNPLHYVTIWLTRGTLAKYRLFDYYSRYKPGTQTELDRDTAMAHVLTMLDCDTRILSHTPTQRYLWLLSFYFPLPAYIHILQDLRKRPLSTHAVRSWTFMGENFEARANCLRQMAPRILFQAMTTGTLSANVIQVWEATELALRESGQSMVQPKLVSIMRDWMSRTSAGSTFERAPRTMDMNSHSNPSLAHSNTGYQNSMPNLMVDDQALGLETLLPFDGSMQIFGDGSFPQQDWSLMNWGL